MGNKTLNEKNIGAALDQVKEALIEADVPFRLIDPFIESVKKESLGMKVLASVKPGEQFVKIVQETLLKFMGGKSPFDFSFQIPSVVMVMGLQGSGKTTSIAKMAHWALKQAAQKNKKRRILFASVDFYRPAAVEQLEILAQQVGVSFYRAMNSDPVLASREITEYCKKNSYEILFLDTAGRLHVDEAMMAELTAIHTAVKPRHTIMVLDAMTGQESLTVAEAFAKNIDFDGALLTKVDSDTRGGAAFAFRHALNKPILFTGSGEKIDDIELFKPDRAVGRILGMGDVVSLVEKAQERIKKEEQQSLEQSLKKGRLTLEDFARQMDMVNNMGSLGSIMKYLPGMGNFSVSPDMIEKAEVEMKQFRAIINSMTPRERELPKILDASRKSRIARGAGLPVAAINSLLERFEQSQQYVKLFKRLGRF